MVSHLPRVIVADDHPPTRDQIARALQAGGFDVCAAVRDAPSAVRAVQEHSAHIAVLDIRMPGNGIRAAREIARSRPTTAVVMLTVSGDDDDLFGAIAAGAVGYIMKGIAADELATTLRKVLDGGSVLPPSMIRRLLVEFARRDRHGDLVDRVPGFNDLTEREREVLDLLGQGLSTRVIAAQMFVSQVTVRTHVAGILRKLQVPDRASAVRLLRSDGS
jgi:DNA-binding NarL/FixJ family response regulator